MKNIVFIFLFLHLSTSLAQRQVYVVYMGEHDGNRSINEIQDLHHSFLSSVKNSKEEAKSSIIRSYKRVINGFSAFLTPDEAAKVSKMDGVISVFKSEPRKMQTTRSWDFVDGLTLNDHRYHSIGRAELLNRTNFGKDVIIGIIDSGVWPESKSFNDEGMGPIPERWQGTCEPGQQFDTSLCNRKLIGAKYYLKGFESINDGVNTNLDYRSARDSAGHGTHTASTAGGQAVPDVSFPGGLARGTASGGAPHARLAIYKACWQLQFDFSKEFRCQDSDMIAAFDDAIADGVDILSVSIVNFDSDSFLTDAISVGSLHAARRNVLVVACAGNDGPQPSSVVNLAPWILTVGAGSIDRSFYSPVILGNGVTLEGQSLTSTNMDKFYPLVFAGDVEIPGTTNSTTTGQCVPNTLSRQLVYGKIVLCFTASQFITVKALAVKDAGGIGVIIQSPLEGNGIPAQSFLIPGTTVLYNDAFTILSYIRYTQYPTAKLVPAKTTINNKPAPIAAGFSSIGPNHLDRDILKPDILAPGLSILAAWSEGAGHTSLTSDKRVVKYNVDYGTSMATPHVAAAAALVKAAHPEWSSAAIKSALMTTASQTNNIGGQITNQRGDIATPFEIGAGHFNPTKAIDPGLVYDVNVNDYDSYICNGRQKSWDNTFWCPWYQSSQLNYPSLVASLIRGFIYVQRTVTNVGDPKSVYDVYVVAPDGFEVSIFPDRLEFEYVGETRSFSVLITRIWRQYGDYSFGWYEWRDGVHFVRSPIVAS